MHKSIITKRALHVFCTSINSTLLEPFINFGPTLFRPRGCVAADAGQGDSSPARQSRFRRPDTRRHCRGREGGVQDTRRHCRGRVGGGVQDTRHHCRVRVGGGVQYTRRHCRGRVGGGVQDTRHHCRGRVG